MTQRKAATVPEAPAVQHKPPAPQPDEMSGFFSSYYLKESLSDVTVLIRIDGDVKQRLPGHGVVLANVSRVFQDQIEKQQGPGGRPSICLDVQYDQVPAASALVRFVYTGHLPEASPEQQSLLVHMLHLAHTFGVTDCEAACYNELLKCNTLQPAALGLAFHLLSPATPADSTWLDAAPTAAAAAPSTGFEPLLKHCLNQLLQQLGDMEAVLTCPALLTQLQSLPLPALLALLHDERTAAASENTVLAVVHCWMTAAAQRDVRVDATQREQLAAAVRLPLLEPCYLATVVPRMNWLTEILGLQGLAAVAGVARALCDPHAEPILGNPRACGGLAAGWMQGPRPLPNSCSRAMHGGPGLTLHWTVALSDVEAAFEAACADAEDRARAQQQQREAAAAAAAAAAAQAALVSTEAPGWGLGGFRSPLAPAAAAAAVSAVASVAAAAAARVWNKRKRSPPAASQSIDEGGRDQHSSSTAAVGAAARAGLQQQQRRRLQPRQQQQGEGADDDADVANGLAPSLQQEPHELLAAEHPTPGSQRHREAAQQGQHGDRSSSDDMPRQPHKRRRRGPAPSEDATTGAGAAAAASAGTAAAAAAAAAAAGATSTPRGGSQAALRASQGQGPRHSQQLSPLAAGQVGAGGSRAAGAGTVGFFSQDASAAAGAAGVAGRAVTPVTTEGSVSSGMQQQQQQRTFKLRSEPVQFAGYNWRMVLYFQPKEPQDAAGALPGAAAGRAAGSSKGSVGAAKQRQAVAAAHAVKLPSEPQDAAATAAVCSGQWTARLALEAWPAVHLPPGVSTAAFSSSLAVKLGSSTRSAAGPAGRSGGAQPGSSAQRLGRSKAAASPAGTGARAGGGSTQDVAPSPARRHERVGSSPARYTGSEGAAAAGGRGRSPAGRQRVAGGGSRGPRAVQADGGQLTAIPESDFDEDELQQEENSQEEEEEEHEEEEEEEEQQPRGQRRQRQQGGQRRGWVPSDSGSSSEEEEEEQQEESEEPSHVQDSEGDDTDADDDDCVEVVGEFPSGPAAAARGRPRSSSRSRQQQQQRGTRTTGARMAAAVQQEAEPVTPGPSAAAGEAGIEDDDRDWRVLHLPQGSWLKSRRCDTGFTSFFSITLQHGEWDAAAWQQYLQPGQVLQLRAKVWNVR